VDTNENHIWVISLNEGGSKFGEASWHDAGFLSFHQDTVDTDLLPAGALRVVVNFMYALEAFTVTQNTGKTDL